MRIQSRVQVNVLLAIILVNTLLFLVANFFTNLINSAPNQFEIISLLGGYDFFKIASGEFWLILTSGFLHFQILHFLLNMYSLYRIGQIVIHYYSEKVLLIVFVLGVIGGSLFTFIASILEYNLSGSISSPLSVGASGGVFALIGLLLGATLRKTRYGFGVPFTLQEILPVVVISLFIGFLPGTNINNFAHIGGLLCGVILGFILVHSGSIKSRALVLLEENMFRIILLLTFISFFALIFNFIVRIFG